MVVYGIDFRHFDKIDYFYNYDVGNKILATFAKELKALTEEDMVFRISGTQLILMIIYKNKNFNIKKFTKKVVNIFKKPIKIDKKNKMQLLTNIGVVIVPKDANSRASLLKNLTLAFEQAQKKYEKVSIEFYSEILGKKVTRDIKLEQKLKHALKNHNLKLYYQPKIDLKSQKIYGFEALLRWEDPELGCISPIDFIPLAEETGQIVKIGKWVLKQACLQCNIWKKKGYDFTISVNVSIRQLQDPNFIKIFKKVFKKTNVDTSMIDLEITESILDENLEEIIDIFNQIKNLGAHISLDDFGTGYSSLSYLRNLPINILKIDKAFINNVCKDPQDAAIAKTIVSLAKILNLKVIAEGTEKKEQIDFLKHIKCDFAQGFYYCKPRDIETIEALIKTQDET